LIDSQCLGPIANMISFAQGVRPMSRPIRFFFVVLLVVFGWLLAGAAVRRAQAHAEVIRPQSRASAPVTHSSHSLDSALWFRAATDSGRGFPENRPPETSVNRTATACASYTVNSLLDATDAAPGNGVCATSGGVCTLRAAIAEGNSNPCVGTRDITFSVTGTITLGNTASNYLSPSKDTNIIGPGANNLIIDGGLNPSTRVFFMNSGTHTISGVTIQGGTVQGVPGPDAGAIQARTGSNLALDSVVIRNNTAEFAGGGFVFESGTFSISNSAMYGNQAYQCGAGLITFGGSLTITNTTISGNQVTEASGGLCSYGTNTRLIVRKSTITGNSCGIGGGGIHSYVSSRLTLGNSIVAGNTTATTRPDLWIEGGGGAAGPFTDEGYNLIGKMDGANENGVVFTAGTPNANKDYVGTVASPIDPRLGPLANNGGPTPTHALLSGGYEIDKGSAVTGITTDQRGLPRPYDNTLVNSATGGDASDIGAYEAQTDLAPPVITIAGGPLIYFDTTVGSVSAPQSYTVTGTDLFANLTVTAPSTDFQVSLSSTTGFGPSISLTPTGGSVPTTSIYVRFSPQSVGTKTGFVTNTTPGAGTQNVLVSGNGTVTCSSFTVNGLGDDPDSNIGNGSCATAGGACTLRAAIQEANAQGCGGSPGITIAVTDIIAPATQLPAITRAMTINGPGAGSLTVTAAHQFRVFNVTGIGFVTFSNLTMAAGQGPTPGNDDYLAGGAVIFRQTGGTIDHCIIRDSSAIAGGGVAGGSAGTTSILNSTIVNNNAGAGGGLYQGGPFNVVISNSTFNDNQSTAGHGGAFHDSSGGGHTITITNSTFSNNRANGNTVGGAIYAVSGTMTVLNSTFTLNFAAQSGGAIYQGGPTQIQNSIFAQNTAGFSAPDLFGSFTTLGNNLIGSNDGNALVAGTPNVGGDYVGTNANPINALLGPLANNGGPTQTHALNCGSLAIDHGSTAAGPPTDQRGIARPAGAATDIGAYEAVLGLTVDAISSPVLFVGRPVNQNLNASGGTGPYTFAITGGTLPSGVTLSTAGVLSGTPTAAGIFPINVEATDSNGVIGCGAFSLTVVNPAPLDFDADGITDYAVVRDGSGSAPQLSTGTSDIGATMDGPPGGRDETLGSLHRGRYFKLPGERFDPSAPRSARSNGAIPPLRWLIRTSGPGADINLLFGALDDFPVPADYDGDGRTDLAVWTGGAGAQFRVLTSSSGYTATVSYTLGNDASDPSVVGDYDGDGRADPAVFNFNSGQWQYLGGPTHANLITVAPAGTVGGVFPVPGDIDGDGRFDFTVEARDGINPTAGHFYQWVNNGTLSPPMTMNFVFGNYRDVVVPGDYDGDGKTDLGLASVMVNPIAWRVRVSGSGTLIGPVAFGNPSVDYTTMGDYDGNRKGEFTVWHSPGLFQSLMGPTYIPPSLDLSWGQSGDYPLAYFNAH
jgi:CSLREA domain-containing protein